MATQQAEVEQTSDPWGQVENRGQAENRQLNPTPLAEKESETYACPHCGGTLRPHHDTVGSLHCDSRDCVGCCFLPPDSTSAGRPRGKLEARPCPMAAKSSGF
jgi:hypothetical protein